MKAMVLPRLVSLQDSQKPLELRELPDPSPREAEILIRISACGVCHTELDEIEGRTAPAHLPIVLGHEVVGAVAALGPHANRFVEGERVGVGWIHHSSGTPDENLSSSFTATGRDVQGGYAEYMTVPQDYAYSIPDVFSDVQAAPLLCAGGIGYRALRLSKIQDGDQLGLMGFGASAHLMLQFVRNSQPHTNVFVFAREAAQRAFALELGASWAGDIQQTPPVKLHAIVDTTPAWKPVVESLCNLRPGGRLVINAIRKEDSDRSYLQNLTYQHHLWMEKEIKSVANITQADIREFLPMAAGVPLLPEVTTYPLERANEALAALRQGGLRGAVVLSIG